MGVPGVSPVVVGWRRARVVRCVGRGWGGSVGVAYGESAAQVVDLVGEFAVECGGEGGVVEGLFAEVEVVGVDGVPGEGAVACGFGDGGAAAGGECGRFGVVAGDVCVEEVGLFGLPEALGGGGEEVVGEGVVVEQGVPGGGFGFRGGEGGAAAGGAFLSGGAGVAGEFGGDGGFVGGAEDAEAGEDAPAEFGVEFGAAGDAAVGEPVEEGVGVGGGVDEVAYGGEAQAGVGAVLGAADEVAAEVGEGGEGGGALVGGGVAAGDLGVGEGEDALDEGEVGFVREVGAGCLEVGGGGSSPSRTMSRAVFQMTARVRASGMPERVWRAVFQDSGSRRTLA